MGLELGRVSECVPVCRGRGLGEHGREMLMICKCHFALLAPSLGGEDFFRLVLVFLPSLPLSWSRADGWAYILP